MEKTPMQELIGELNKSIKELQNINEPSEFIRGLLAYAHGIKESIKELNLLEKEKQVIVEAVIDTTKDCWQSLSETLGINLDFTDEDLKNQQQEAQDYYNQKFKQ